MIEDNIRKRMCMYLCVCERERERETGPFLLYSRNGHNGVNQLDFNKTAFFKFTLPLSKKWK